ncbi:hypothetical protein F4825DRAFT_477495 [Nemania diffusa]|nr:hypothetical protein F4825DRAFT_477495 [Nemania diffusa]
MSDSFIDNLAAQATVNDDGNIRLIKIPNIELLTEAQRIAVLERAEQRWAQAALQPAPVDEALLARLRDMTPPYYEEDMEEDVRYPPGLEVPLRNPPAEYRAIVGYWQPTSSWRNGVLAMQMWDWKNFRTWQLGHRRRYPDAHFSKYVDLVAEKRQQHGLAGDVHLRPEVKEQTRAQNWLEYQCYHLVQLEKLEKERERLVQRQQQVRENPGPNDGERVFTLVVRGIEEEMRRPSRVDILEGRIRTVDGQLERHANLRRWIEMQWPAMGEDGAAVAGPRVASPSPSSPLQSPSPSLPSQNRQERRTESLGVCGGTGASRQLRKRRASTAQPEDISKLSVPARKRRTSRSLDAAAPGPSEVVTTRSGQASKPPE